ncbi:MAG: N-formylglutamate amidohydrolase [Gemmobacter sp.]|nr:N-formylglutamate amidohydrolase [Gemmobacter sp.]
MINRAYDLLKPKKQETAAVFASPHSGRDYTNAFLGQTVLDERTIRSSEDAFVDKLFAAAPACGAPLLIARAPRAWIDMNRAPDELDPALIEGIGRGALNPRVSSGLGVIPRVVSGGRAIYRGKLALAEAERRIATHWHPYHAALQALMRQTRLEFGQVLVIDCHSMPHDAISNHTRPGGIAPEVVLGDRHGSAAGAGMMDGVEAAFIRAGFRVVRNNPFAGAYITQAYGRPSVGQHVVQVEIDRSLYMDEATIQPHAGFDVLRGRLAAVVEEIAELGRTDTALAAE